MQINFSSKTAISANHEAYRLWLQSSQASTSTDPPPLRATSNHATPNQASPSSITPISSQHALLIAPQPTPAHAASNLHTQATVPRPMQPIRGDSSTPSDLTLQACQTTKNADLLDTNRMNWDPHLLFPELCTLPTRKDKSHLMSARTNSTKLQTSAHTVQSQPLHRTTKGRINKKASSQSRLEKLDAQAFVDIPLQYDEGQMILQLIGAQITTIPERLMGLAQLNVSLPPPSQAQTHDPPAQAQNPKVQAQDPKVQPSLAQAHPSQHGATQAHTPRLPSQAQHEDAQSNPPSLPPKRGRPRRASSSHPDAPIEVAQLPPTRPLSPRPAHAIKVPPKPANPLLHTDDDEENPHLARLDCSSDRHEE